jgi:hypothetical protein
VRDVVFEAIREGAVPKLLDQATGDDARERKLLDDLQTAEQMIQRLDDDYYDGKLDDARYRRQVERFTRRVEQLQAQLRGNGHARIALDLPSSRAA